MASDRRLHVGCGGRKLHGFINLDIAGEPDLKCDVREGLPFPDGSISRIFSEHFIEHLTRPQAIRFLLECYRALEPGGVCRIATPDLDDLVSGYTSNDWREREWISKFGFEWVPNKCVMLNIGLRSFGHRHNFNYDDLAMAGALAGFLLARRCKPGESTLADLRSIEYRQDSVVIEFVKECDALRDQLPLVSILVPAYNHRFLKQALHSGLAQTYPNCEIIVCNDNPAGQIDAVMAEFTDHPRIRYCRNPQNMGAVANYIECLRKANGTLIKFLNDDDLLHADCVRRMVCYMQAYGERISLVTSKRQRIDAAGLPLRDDYSTTAIVPQDSYVNRNDLADLMLSRFVNLVGEPTTVMFRKADLANLLPAPISFHGRSYGFNVDLAMSLTLLTKGDVIYIVQPLSCFRIHPKQDQKNPRVRFGLIRAWSDFVNDSRAAGFLSTPDAYGQALVCLVKLFRSSANDPSLTQPQAEELVFLAAKAEAELAGIPADPAAKQSRRFRHCIKRIHRSEGWRPPLRYCFTHAGVPPREKGPAAWIKLCIRRLLRTRRRTE